MCLCESSHLQLSSLFYSSFFFSTSWTWSHLSTSPTVWAVFLHCLSPASLTGGCLHWKLIGDCCLETFLWKPLSTTIPRGSVSQYSFARLFLLNSKSHSWCSWPIFFFSVHSPCKSSCPFSFDIVSVPWQHLNWSLSSRPVLRTLDSYIHLPPWLG